MRIVESTPARIHVRWSYQSCDFNYKTWGDSAVEDFYFYPDGFGTRVLTLQAAPEANYELSELIVLTPPSAYPLDVLPPNLVDILFLDGEKRALTFPFSREEQGAKLDSRELPAVYRIRMHKNESAVRRLLQPARQQIAPRRVWPFLRPGPARDAGILGQPLAAGAREDDRRSHRRPDCVHGRATTASSPGAISIAPSRYERPDSRRSTQTAAPD